MSEVELIGSFNCPHCGETETIAAKECAELVKAGKIPPGQYPERKEIIALMSPTQAALTVPVIIKSWDMCARCGQEYIIKVEKQDAPIKAMPSQQPPFGGPGPFGMPPPFGNPPFGGPRG